MSTTETSMSQATKAIDAAKEFLDAEVAAGRGPADGVPAQVVVEDGQMRLATATELARLDDEQLTEAGLDEAEITALREVAAAERAERIKDPTNTDDIRIVPDQSGALRFATGEDKAMGLAKRDVITAELRELLPKEGYKPEYVEEVITDLFEGRTDDQPPAIPTGIVLYGRKADEIGDDERGELGDAFDEHMEDVWGF